MVPGAGVTEAGFIEVDASASALALVGPGFFPACSPNRNFFDVLFGMLDVLEWSVGIVSVFVCTGDE